MAISLKDNLTSSYFSAAHKLYSKKARRRIVAYVESYDDVAFWRTLLEEFEDEEHYFQVMLPSATSLAKGKKMVLMNTLNTAELGKSLIACVDSDYDFLLQGATSTSRKINRNKYIFQTYAYAIENYHCYADSLHEVCVQATLNDRHLIDFNEFMKRYSRIVYPLFLWSVWFYRRHDTYTFSMSEFNGCVRLHDVSLRHPERSLEVVRRSVTAKLSELSTRFPQGLEEIDRLSAITINKWMFIYASICYIPFSYQDIAGIEWNSISTAAIYQVLYVVLCGSFIAYICIMTAQKLMRPTVVSMYNYVQPIVASIAAILMGIGSFGWEKGVAIALVFLGVYFVTQSKSKADLEGVS
jgi:hypothetical protein